MKIPTIEEYWKLSRVDRQLLFEKEGISGKFLRDYWQPYKNPGSHKGEVRLAAMEGFKQREW